ncbi:MAG: putative Mg2+ transporter-C (MgtC) family protein [Solirubrobacteraceae bacterium]|nr:putative Mg2+ transporter-C (MgtC) family protein [Solirubrobacteraceae bacterium]
MATEWDVLWRLGLALALSTAIGLEREMRQKSAGLRTHTLVGVGSALFVLVSAYGFSDVLAPGRVVLDPSRVAAQVVSGIGFIGGGIIFVRRDAVLGLTTAAGVWLTAAVGMAAAADLPLLATAARAGYFLVAFGYPAIARRLPSSKLAPSSLRLTYRDGQGILRDALTLCTGAGFAVADVAVQRLVTDDGDDARAVAVRLELVGPGSLADLASELDDLDGVLAVSTQGDRAE